MFCCRYLEFHVLMSMNGETLAGMVAYCCLFCIDAIFGFKFLLGNDFAPFCSPSSILVNCFVLSLGLFDWLPCSDWPLRVRVCSKCS